MKVSDEVIDVLANSETAENKLFLPPTQLERKLYVAVNKALEALGGKWNRKEKSHVFDFEPDEAIEKLLQTGEYVCAKKEFQFFETPEWLAKKMVDIADIQPGDRVLEPSAGRGAIARHLLWTIPLRRGVGPAFRGHWHKPFFAAAMASSIYYGFLKPQR
jgi:hypothetical protein